MSDAGLERMTNRLSVFPVMESAAAAVDYSCGSVRLSVGASLTSNRKSPATVGKRYGRFEVRGLIRNPETWENGR